ncbi:hypothetical protein [Paenibacillus sp. Marseille-Q4541]|uniref:hypothetical protein n=1 Tax=Paenibacillus sp. Marseille-Q4541 TaxID=2831522 RepID=UPI001BAE1D9E|nr:hypothetical protein [Paenibacillus sp. Marseille-Q4541]
MYLIAQKNVMNIKQLIDIYIHSEEIVSSRETSSSEKKEKCKDIELRLEHVLQKCTLDDLRVIYAVASIGSHERGERHYYSNNSIEIIELDIRENEEELIFKHSKYISFLTKEELIEYFLSQAFMTQSLNEGMKILKLS